MVDLFSRLKVALFGSPASPPTEVIEHQQLGTLRFDPEVGAWRTVVASPHGSIGFLIAGKRQPDTRLLAHAVDIVSSAEAFLQRTRTYLEAEAARDPRWSTDVLGLTLEEVRLFWPARPDDGMLYFSAPRDDLRVWRCDYVNREPQRLGFDS